MQSRDLAIEFAEYLVHSVSVALKRGREVKNQAVSGEQNHDL